MVRLGGVLTAMITPFDGDDSVDEAALREFIEWQIGEGISGLVPCGTTGESPTLSTAEHDRVVALTVETVAGRVPVIAGTGSNSTAEAVARTRHAERAGADVAMLVTPYYNKPNEDGMVRHFETVLEQTDGIPIIIYNIPGRSVVDFLPSGFARLMGNERLLGVKDATKDLVRPAEMCALMVEAGRSENFFQLTGEDPTALAFLAQGGNGCISVTSNVAPRLCVERHRAWEANDPARAREIDARLQPLHAALFASPSPGPTKYALSLSRKVQNISRLPIGAPPGEVEAQVRAALAFAGLAN